MSEAGSFGMDREATIDFLESIHADLPEMVRNNNPEFYDLLENSLIDHPLYSEISEAFLYQIIVNLGYYDPDSFLKSVESWSVFTNNPDELIPLKKILANESGPTKAGMMDLIFLEFETSIIEKLVETYISSNIFEGIKQSDISTLPEFPANISASLSQGNKF